LLQAQNMFRLSLSFISIFPRYIQVKFTTLLEKIKNDENYTNNKKEYVEKQSKDTLAVKLVNLSRVSTTEQGMSTN